MSLTILALSGSLRRRSLNTALLHTAAERAPRDAEIVVHDLHDLPFYDGDVEAAGLPAPVRQLRTATDEADGLLLAFPEYNWSIPAVMKNAVDWLSRGPDSPLDHKPTALLSAAGGGGGRRAQAHMRDVLGHNRVEIVEPTLQVPRAREHVVDGRLVTPELLTRLGEVLEALVAAVRDRPAEAA